MEWMNQASTSAQKSDAVFWFVFALSVVFLVFITALMIYFVVRYSKRRNPVATPIEDHAVLEAVWTGVPLVLFLVIFYYGWTNYNYVRQAPRDSMVVKVAARQWSWSFQYPNGKQTTELYVPLGKPMKLDIRSQDVVHGFYIAAFRLKIDALPNRDTYTWFEATKLGAYDIQCTVICGVKHSAMLSRVVVVPEEEFRAWYFGDENAPLPGTKVASLGESAHPPIPDEPAGLKVMRQKGCLTCHSTDGRTMVGPTFKGIFGRTSEVVLAQAGEIVPQTADEAYLRRSIEHPQDQLVRGYPPAMPPQRLEAKELDEVVSYLKTLK
jgi:cytochrome c oxidase subunit 2